jgi:RNA polymerase sigma-70 factor (ECF subfamily)
VDNPADSDSEFVRRARTGNRRAFASLVGRYWGPLRRWLWSLSRGAEGADDWAQETFLKAWVALPTLADGAAFRPWLFRIARNEFLASVRAARPAAELLPDVADRRASSSELAAEREAECRLLAAVSALPEGYRTPYLLWTQTESGYSEIAAVLDISEEAARWRVSEARRRLAAALSSYLEGDSR